MKQLGGANAGVELHRPASLRSPAAAGSQAPAEQALFQPEVARSLQMHWKLALVATCLGLAVTALYFSRLWPVYEAKSLLYVQPAATGVMDQNNANRWPIDGATYESFIQQKMADVIRPDVLLAAVKKMEPGLWQKAGESDQSAADRLTHAVMVERFGAYQITIGVRSKKPEDAAALASAVTKAYLETAALDSHIGSSQRLAILREEHDRVQTELNADRAEQTELSRQLGVAVAGANAPDMLDDQIGRIRAELMRARIDHDAAAARFASMNAANGSSSSAVDAQAEEAAGADAGLTSMKTTLNQRRATLVSQMANLTPNHPLYKQDATELDKINQELDKATHDLHTQAVNRIQQKLHSDLQRTATVEDQLNGQLRSAVGTAAGASVKMQRANDLSADINRLQTRFGVVDEQLHNLMLDTSSPGVISLINPAVVPLHPMKNGVFRNTFVLACVSCVFGLFVAILAHKLDKRVYIASDVETLLGFPPLAQLPDFDQVSAEIAEEQLFRLAADIDHAARSGGIHSVALTGSAEGVGVSTLAAQLRAILQPAAAPAEAAAGLAILETAPVLLSAEAEYQVRNAGWTIAVVESGVTTKAELRNLAGALRRLDVPAVAFVLNRVSLRTADPAFRTAINDAQRHIRRRGERAPLRMIPGLGQNELAAAALAHALDPAHDQLPAPAPVPSVSALPRPAAQPATSFPPLSSVTIASVPEPKSASADGWWSASFAPEPAAASLPLASVPSAPQVAPAAPQDDFSTAPPPSRLNGLRGSRFHNGLRNLGHPGVAAPPEAWYVQAPEPRPPVAASQPARTAAPPQTAAPFVAAPPRSPVAAPVPAAAPVPPPVPRPAEVVFTPSAREVVAQPEFLPPPPPREFVPVRAADESDNEGNARRDRRDPYDSLNILPSWRGQYRKKG